MRVGCVSWGYNFSAESSTLLISITHFFFILFFVTSTNIFLSFFSYCFSFLSPRWVVAIKCDSFPASIILQTTLSHWYHSLPMFRCTCTSTFAKQICENKIYSLLCINCVMLHITSHLFFDSYPVL